MRYSIPFHLELFYQHANIVNGVFGGFIYVLESCKVAAQPHHSKFIPYIACVRIYDLVYSVCNN